MPLVQQIQQDLSTAMKARDKDRLETLRMVKSALKNEEISVGRGLDDESALKVLQRLCKQRKESIDQFESGGRPELAAKERAELMLIEQYMPNAPDDDSMRAAVAEAVASTGATSPRQMGNVMKAVMAHFAGQPVDGKKVSQMVREALGG